MEGMYHPGSDTQHQAPGAPGRCEGGCVLDPFRCQEPPFLRPPSVHEISKLTRDSLVVITMYPHDRLDGAEPRTFTLTKEKRQVDVGRASRNLDRGAQPELDNAVFKCPIMSRSHARFTASPVEKVSEPHSTFIDRRPG